MKKIIFIVFLLVKIIEITNGQTVKCFCIPNKKAAIAKVKPILIRKYGKEIKKYLFNAELNKDNIWVVWGYLRDKGVIGGFPYVEIRKDNCVVVKMYRTK